MSKLKLIRCSTIPLSLNIFCKGLLEHLSQDYEVVALSSPGKDLDEVRIREGVRTIGVAMERKISLWRDLLSLLRLIAVFRRERPDVVHSMTPKAGLLCMLASKLTGVPVRIHTFTGLVFPTVSGWKQKILIATDRITCGCATHVIPEGEGVKNDLLKYGITSKPLQVLGYGNIRGIDLNYYRCDESIQGQAQEIRQRYDNAFIFLYVGRILDEKGMRELATAYKRFDEAHAHSRLLLVGPIDTQGGLDSETLSMILEHPHIEQIGFLPDVRAYYAASDCFVFPSYREGFPNVVIEAGAMSLPCIVTDINGSREIIQHNKTGLVVDVKNETALYEAMEYMYTHPIEAKQMSAQACTWVKEHYEQSYVWSCLETYYKQVIQEKIK